MRVDVLPQSLVDEIRQILDVKNDPDAFLTGDGARYADKDMSFHPPAPSAAVALPLTCDLVPRAAALVKSFVVDDPEPRSASLRAAGRHKSLLSSKPAPHIACQ